MLKYSQLVLGSKAFVENEKRDAMYRVSTYLINEFWGKPEDIADALGVLLLTWNQAFYRYGGFDSDDLESCLKKNSALIQQYRNRDIFTYAPNDDSPISKLFNEMLIALKTDRGKSPVAVAKALHLLAPNFFPLWDAKIAENGYDCYWGAGSSAAAQKYLCLMKKTQVQVEDIVKSYSEFGVLPLDEKRATLVDICKSCSNNLPFQKSILKIIDEHNYAKYTKGWI